MRWWERLAGLSCGQCLTLAGGVCGEWGDSPGRAAGGLDAPRWGGAGLPGWTGLASAPSHQSRPVPGCWSKESFTATVLFWPNEVRVVLGVQSCDSSLTRLFGGLGSSWICL